MELNLEQLNGLSRIIAEEILKRGKKEGFDVEIIDNSQCQSHVTKGNGKVYNVLLELRLYPGRISKWYLIHPSKEGDYVAVYPHSSKAVIYSNIGTIEAYESNNFRINFFKEKNREVQKYLESISIGVEIHEPSGDRSWIIDAVKVFEKC